MKKIISVILAIVMIMGTVSFSLSAAAETRYNYTITTKFYGYDSATEDWVPVTTASGGDKVKMRVFVSTNFYSASASILFGYDNKVLRADDAFAIGPFYTTINESSDFVNNKIDSVRVGDGNRAAENQLGYGNLTEEQVDNNSFISATIYTKGCYKYEGEDWIFEIDMQVLNGTKGEELECVVFPGTVMTKTNKKGMVNFPFSETESDSHTSATTAYNWYEDTPVLVAEKALITADNITGDVYPSDYDFETDRYSFRADDVEISGSDYADIYGPRKGELIYDAVTASGADGSYGMAFTTGMILAGKPSASTFDGSESISKIGKDTPSSELDGATAEEFIARNEALYASTDFSGMSCAEIYEAVYDYLYNGGKPVVITMKTFTYSKLIMTWEADCAYSVLAVGLSGNNGILVDDPTSDTVQKIIFAQASDGSITDTWSYSGGENIGGDNVYDTATGKAGFIDSVLVDAEPSAKEKNVIRTNEVNALVGNAEATADPNLYWANGDDEIILTEDEPFSEELEIASENASVKVSVNEDRYAKVIHSDSKDYVEQNVKDSAFNICFTFNDSDGNPVELYVCGFPEDDVITVERDGTKITVTGASEFFVDMEKDDGYIQKTFENLNGEATDFFFDPDNFEIKGKEYTVKWISEDVEFETSLYQKGDSIVTAVAPPRYGYSFVGWNADVPDFMPAEDLTFVAQWQVNTYDAVFNAQGGEFANGGEILVVPVVFGDEITVSETPVMQGYKFAGWADENGESVADFGKMDTEDGKIFYATWVGADDIAYTVETYTMKTDGEYEVVTASYTGTTGETVTAEVSAPEGFTFNEKESVVEGAVKADGSLVLKVYYDRNKYVFTTVVSGTETAKEYYYGEAVETPATPSLTGYSFIGWGGKIPEVMPAENLTFIAQWQANTYDAVFNAQGGEFANGGEILIVPVAFGDEIIVSETPVMQGYKFAGWADENGEIIAAPGKMDTEGGKNFYAAWVNADDIAYTVETYTMKTDGTYALTTTSHTGTTGETATAEVSVPEGFTFNGGKSVVSDVIKADGSLVLKVYYDRNKYVFTTVVSGTETTKEYYYGEAVETPATPSLNGYNFVGWSGEIPSVMPAGNVTVTAVFSMKTAIRIDNNPGSKSINYGEILRLRATVTDLPDGAYVKWYAEGGGVSISQNADGTVCEVKSTGSGTAKITAKVVDRNGNPVKNVNGAEISDSQTVKSNGGIWQKIVSFFKNLFGMNRVIVQYFRFYK